MKELTYICLVCSLFILLISCSFTPKDSPQSFIGKKLIVDKNWDSTFDSIFLQKELVLVSYVDSNECTPCALERFQYIQANSHKLEESNIATILIFLRVVINVLTNLKRFHRPVSSSLSI